MLPLNQISRFVESDLGIEVCWKVSCYQSVDPHGLAPWVNEIGQLDRTSTAMEDPHELASWVNEIPGCRTEASTTGAKASPLAFNLVHPRGKLGGRGSLNCRRVCGVAFNLVHPRGKLVGVLKLQKSVVAVNLVHPRGKLAGVLKCRE